MVEWAITGQNPHVEHIPPVLVPVILNNAREEAKGRKKNVLSLSRVSGGGEEEMRTTQADISHVDKQIQGLPCPFFQCIHDLLMQAEFRRMEERKMERGRLGDWKKGGGKQHGWRPWSSGVVITRNSSF